MLGCQPANQPARGPAAGWPARHHLRWVPPQASDLPRAPPQFAPRSTACAGVNVIPGPGPGPVDSVCPEAVELVDVRQVDVAWALSPKSLSTRLFLFLSCRAPSVGWVDCADLHVPVRVPFSFSVCFVGFLVTFRLLAVAVALPDVCGLVGLLRKYHKYWVLWFLIWIGAATATCFTSGFTRIPMRSVT